MISNSSKFKPIDIPKIVASTSLVKVWYISKYSSLHRILLHCSPHWPYSIIDLILHPLLWKLDSGFKQHNECSRQSQSLFISQMLASDNSYLLDSTTFGNSIFARRGCRYVTISSCRALWSCVTALMIFLDMAIISMNLSVMFVCLE